MRCLQVVALVGALVAIAAPPGWAQQQQAGVAAAVRGQVEIAERTGAVGRLAKSGEPIYLGNAIKSGADSGLQILLLDQTTFTIGPNSELTIDEFVFDPSTSAGKVTASVAKGVFRFVTGKVAQQQPTNMQVKLPAGTIGIRGTIAMGRVDQVNQNGAPTNRQQVILVGPGQKTEANKVGGIDVSAGGATTNINQPGFGSTLLGRGQWGPAERFDPAVIAEIAGALRKAMAPGQQGESQQAGGASGASNAGQSTTDAMGPATSAEQLTTQILLSDLFVSNASQPIGADVPREVGQPFAIDGITTREQLNALPVPVPLPGGGLTSQFTYTQTGVPLISDNTIVGSYSIFFNIDFGKKSVGGNGSRVELSSSFANGSVALPEISFAGGTGPAVFLYYDLPGVTGGGCGESQNCTTTVVAAPVNSQGVTANQLIHDLLVFNDNADAVLSGAGLADRGAGTTSNPFAVNDGPSTYDQLRTLNAGTFFWSQSSVPMSGGTFATYNIFLNVDFGARQVGGGSSRVEFDGGSNGSLPLGPINYNALAGQAGFNYSGPISISACIPTCTATVNTTPNNVGGVVAQTLSHNVSVGNGSSVPGTTGSGITGPRAAGSAPLPP